MVSKKIRERRVRNEEIETICICNLLGKKHLSNMFKFINLSTMIVCSSMFIGQLNAAACKAYKNNSCKSQYQPHTQWCILIGFNAHHRYNKNVIVTPR